VQRAARKAATNNPLAPPRHHQDTTGRKVDTAAEIGTPAFVWIKSGDSLIERMVMTGLNNDTQVQILSGLSTDDQIVNGTEVATAAAKSSGAVRSPFMPARRPSNTGSRPAGGGGAGGGAR
jgi:HlyD family secretion protein